MRAPTRHPEISWCGRPTLVLALLLGALGHSLKATADETGQPAGNSVAKRVNRLAKESSPYLLQHAHNPVDWYPWGPEAFETAKQKNQPIFLSIGYSSCFWCHVMERQVFENEELAKYMNEHFVCIKVDREERPDIDEIYMLALQVYFQMAGSNQGGGWPISIFLTPAGEPIAGGTYFPPADAPGRPGFMTVMQQIHGVWETQHDAVLRTSAVLASEVKRLSQPPLVLETSPITSMDVQSAVAAVLAGYDPEFGGFDFDPNSPTKPKFPVPSRLMLIQAQLAQTTAETASLAAKLDHTLQAMAEGGIYDQLGGGFHRYSTDREWMVPHFEKMLYDNAQLAEVFAEAYLRTRREQYKEITEGIFQYVEEMMTDPQGGFYSALDAETDGVEGEYYVWSREEVQGILAPAGYRYFATAYGLDQPTPFEHGYVLHLAQSLPEIAQKQGIPQNELSTRLARLREELLAKRRTRKPLRRDDKILTSWNGLMIRAYARAGKILKRQDYLDRAAKAALYLLTTLRDREGRLLRTARHHQGSLPAYLDDYAFFVSGLLALHDATGEEKWLNTARLLTDNQISLFWDRDRGGFYFTAHDHESLIARTKSAYDSVIPSGNSVSLQNLTRLGKITGEKTYFDYAVKTQNALSHQLRQSPEALAYFALASQESLAANHSPPSGGAGNLFTGGVSTPQSSSPRGGENSLVVGLKSTGPIDKDSKIKVQGFFEKLGVQASQEVQFAIQIEITPEWHINANPAQPDFVIPTELKLAGDSPLELNEVQYPKGHEFRLDGIEEPLRVYEGTVVLRGRLKIPTSTASSIPVKLQLRTQACNNKSCLAPKQIILEGSIQILPPGQSETRINQKFFAQP